MLVWAVDTLLHKYPPPPSSTLPYLHHRPVGLSRWWHSDGTIAYKMHTLQLYANVVSLYHCITYQLRIWNCWAGRWYSDRARQHWHIATGCAFYICHCAIAMPPGVFRSIQAHWLVVHWENETTLAYWLTNTAAHLTILQYYWLVLHWWHYLSYIYAISHIISTCCYLLLAYISTVRFFHLPKLCPRPVYMHVNAKFLACF